jgi:serine/threonine protein kinase
MEPSRSSLPVGTTLCQYVIKQLIASGGFGLIYLAEDLDSQEDVVVKEFLPKKLAQRASDMTCVEPIDAGKIDTFNQSLKLFYREIKVLASLTHPNIVHIRNCFLANHTSYLVMDYESGENLAHYIKKHRGGLSLGFMMAVFPPLLDALNLIHSRSLLHLDIKPNNIHLRPGGSPLLLDFGAVHRFATTRRSDMGQIVTTGFSPVEQYYHVGYVGPWSDVYAIGASMRACIEGRPPPSAIARHAKDTLAPASQLFKRRYPSFLLEAIDWAMEVDPLLRPQNAGELLEALEQRTGRPPVNLTQRPRSNFGPASSDSAPDTNSDSEG